MILFLDDNDNRGAYFMRRNPDTVWVKTVDDCILQLSRDVEWDSVWLDHDLNGEAMVDSNRTDCGMEVVRWMSEHPARVKFVVVHSYNHGAAEAMINLLNRSGYVVHRVLLPIVQ